jgi:hypothetical protein
MKRTIPSYSTIIALALLSTPSFAQTTAQPVKTASVTSTNPSPTCGTGFVFLNGACLTQAQADAIAAAPVNFYRPASAPTAKEADVTLSASDLEKAGISLQFSGTQIQLQGTIPAACADNLVMDSVRHAASGDSEDSDGFANKDDLNNHTSEVGVRVSFKGSDSAGAFADCLTAERNSTTKDLTSLAKLNKAMIDPNEYARAGMMDDSGKITITDKSPQSDAYKKVSKVIEFKDCDSCKISIKKIQKAMGELDDQPAVASPLRIALIDKGLEDTGKQLESADSLRKLKAIRDDLVSYAKWVGGLKSNSDDRDSLLGKISQHFSDLQKVTGELAYKDPTHAGKYADMISETAGIIASQHYLDKDIRDQQKEVQAAYKKGGSMRLTFVSQISPDNSEVREYLNGGADMIHNAHANAVSKCQMIIRTPAKVDACNQAITQMKQVQSQVDTLAKNFNTAQSIPTDLQQNSKNFYTANGAPPAGSYAVGSQPGGTQNAAAIQSVFGLNQGVFGNTSAYAPTGSAYQVTAPNYQSAQGSQFQIANPTVAVPLNQSLLNTQQGGNQLTTPYSFST